MPRTEWLPLGWAELGLKAGLGFSPYQGLWAESCVCLVLLRPRRTAQAWLRAPEVNHRELLPEGICTNSFIFTPSDSQGLPGGLWAGPGDGFIPSKASSLLCLPGSAVPGLLVAHPRNLTGDKSLWDWALMMFRGILLPVLTEGNKPRCRNPNSPTGMGSAHIRSSGWDPPFIVPTAEIILQSTELILQDGSPRSQQGWIRKKNSLYSFNFRPVQRNLVFRWVCSFPPLDHLSSAAKWKRAVWKNGLKRAGEKKELKEKAKEKSLTASTYMENKSQKEK